MGIVDWFTNDINTEERILTRYLLKDEGIAIIDHFVRHYIIIGI